ncbi:type II toxin-antitoxin system VapC family toxin [Phyllobacterium zundukense]|jgi:PIN domain nuclease of toxin-antitoxin system|uniref:Type II toxin-antitoxin system VapC family toxin n=1 Tax=Phyllobacterium zundukense TaxID=1867719 RepID=A0ACD4D416_9HYPH|nr:type II toxin-antitoxin system VapC family toxin [Phyllobacterium zundukense]UXN60475.1 type II toxin-antitoxin system VapC family toxin [Phyllobacterium zundukense]
MHLLLDTHVLLWWDEGADKLGAVTRDAIANPDNQIYISAASIWEIAIKSAKGKLRFSGSPHAAIERNGFLPLSISSHHAELAGHLAWSHPDPFDRMLIAQAQHDGMILVHADSVIYTYKEVPQLWARDT